MTTSNHQNKTYITLHEVLFSFHVQWFIKYTFDFKMMLTYLQTHSSFSPHCLSTLLCLLRRNTYIGHKQFNEWLFTLLVIHEPCQPKATCNTSARTRQWSPYWKRQTSFTVQTRNNFKMLGEELMSFPPTNSSFARINFTRLLAMYRCNEYV